LTLGTFGPVLLVPIAPKRTGPDEPGHKKNRSKCANVPEKR